VTTDIISFFRQVSLIVRSFGNLRPGRTEETVFDSSYRNTDGTNTGSSKVWHNLGVFPINDGCDMGPQRPRSTREVQPQCDLDDLHGPRPMSISARPPRHH
jgi:hypothetical protein